jgi:hypothetical protein
MFSTLAVLVFFCAFALPLLLLYRLHAGPWYLHVLALAAAVGLGLMHTPEAWKSPAFDMAVGAVFVFLAVWGIGGLVAFHSHREKHA